MNGLCLGWPDSRGAAPLSPFSQTKHVVADRSSSMSGVSFASLFEAKRKLSAAPAADRPAKQAKKQPPGAPMAPAAAAPSAAPQVQTMSKNARKKQKKKAAAAAAAAVAANGTAPSIAASSSKAAGSPSIHQPPPRIEAIMDDAKGKKKLARKQAAQLAGAQFRFINEQLYTTDSAYAVKMFADEPELFEVYHEGFRSQAAHWPMRPVQAIADWLRATQPPKHSVADLGCGDAELAASVPHKVHSFDLVAANPSVVACDIADVPLPDSSVHVCVFSLALMGVNFSAFLCEAHRLLRPKGILKIAEVASRIDDMEGWDALLIAIGFDAVSRDDSNSHFTLFEFVKSDRPRAEELPAVRLKPCIYKRR